MSIRTWSAIAATASLSLCISSAQAFVAINIEPLVSISDPVQGQDGSYAYRYTLANNTTCFGNCSDTIFGQPIGTYQAAVREFALPYFSDAGITAIQSPANWQYTIAAEDRFGLGSGAQTLVWTAQADDAGIAAAGGSLGGFSYTAGYAAGKGPFSVTLGIGISMLGDPAIPLSPGAVAAGIEPMLAVPEPQTYALLLAGLAVVGAALRAKSRSGG